MKTKRINPTFFKSFFVLIASVLSACSSHYTVKAYKDGAAEVSQLATLTVAEDLELVALDGEPVKTYLLDGLTIDYQIAPGPHSAVVRYAGVWANPQSSREEVSSRADRIQSDMLRVDFEALAGQHYQFLYEKPADRAAALAARDRFRVSLVDADGRQVAVSTVFRPAEEGRVSEGSAVSPGKRVVDAVAGTVKRVLTESAPEQAISFPRPDRQMNAGLEKQAPQAQGGAAPMVSPSGGGLPRLEAMKLMWQNATKEEKKAFLRWAFQ